MSNMYLVQTRLSMRPVIIVLAHVDYLLYQILHVINVLKSNEYIAYSRQLICKC